MSQPMEEDQIDDGAPVTIQARFELFHAMNPQVMDELRRLVVKARANGHNKLAIGMLWEVMRWNLYIETTPIGDGDYKLNDHYRSRYARRMMEEDPSLDGFFEIRTLRSP